MRLEGARAVVVGGGFYGACIAEHLGRRGAAVTIVEREPGLMARASYCNQARLHGGYHYPRSFGTAYRSRLNFPRFRREFSRAIVDDFVKIYAIARANSKVNARQFQTFCRNIGAPLKLAGDRHRKLFSRTHIEAVFEAEEFVFDAAVLAQMMTERLEQANVTTRLCCRVLEVARDANRGWRLALDDGSGMNADLVYNCTYSGINAIGGLPPTQHGIRHEVTEMALVELPAELAGLSVTVMDGPFFSFMPFPPRGLSTLSHVRYTPHASWSEAVDGVRDPYATLEQFEKDTRFGYMIRDARRFIPSIGEARYRDSLFEVKTVLLRNEFDDGRPILFETSPQYPGVYWVLGSKIDNIYDALSAVDEDLKQSSSAHQKSA